jgi:hypothetical protein
MNRAARIVGIALAASVATYLAVALADRLRSSERWADMMAVLEAEHVVRARARKIGVSR